MPPKTAQQLIEEEIKELRRDLMRDVSKRSELRAEGYEDYEIDDIIQDERDEVEREVDEHRAKLMTELPEREAELEEERLHIFAVAAFRNVWLPQCLIPVDGEPSKLVTKEAYEHYLAWCEAVGICEPYSLGTVRNALKEHYIIDNIRTGLRAYRLAEVTTKVNREQLISRYEADERRQEREAAKLRDLVCSYCERRRFDGNRFDRCYWCSRILKDGFHIALAEYMADGDHRTGESMHLAYQRMVVAGEIEQPSDEESQPTRHHHDTVARNDRPTSQPGEGFWAKLRNLLGF